MLVSRLLKRGLSINPDIHHSKVPSSAQSTRILERYIGFKLNNLKQ